MGQDLANLLIKFRDVLVPEGTVQEALVKALHNTKVTDTSKPVNNPVVGLFAQKHGYGTSADEIPLHNKNLEKASHHTVKKDSALFDDMVRNGEEKVHVYGKHSENVKRHINNINV
ncbi:unnamed protein product [Diatraea saccharalis]|uniref:Uncharacterized protein n=1 Tax=Diatraea saccharalis TaxID=40085 RepID=A0A9N9RBY8_9NEOP|nr:unnamed protein product [Diatraea saccharalis]